MTLFWMLFVRQSSLKRQQQLQLFLTEKGLLSNSRTEWEHTEITVFFWSFSKKVTKDIQKNCNIVFRVAVHLLKTRLCKSVDLKLKPTDWVCVILLCFSRPHLPIPIHAEHDKTVKECEKVNFSTLFPQLFLFTDLACLIMDFLKCLAGC